MGDANSTCIRVTIVYTDESSVEQSLAAWRQVRATQAIADIQRESARKGTDTMSMDDIDAEVKKIRQARRNRTP